MKKTILIALVVLLSAQGIAFSKNKRENIAILPFKDLSPFANMSWLSEGINSTLSTKLSEAKDLTIIERCHIRKVINEVMLSMKGITEGSEIDTGKMLGATILIVGEFQVSGQDIKIDARLINVNTGKVEGSDEVVGNLKDIFFLQDKLCLNILKIINKKMHKIGKFDTLAIATSSLEAYEQYSIAKKVWDGKSFYPEKIEVAISHFRKALRYDPDYFLAAIGLADALKEMAEIIESIKWYKYALKISEKIIENTDINDVKAANYCKDKVYEKLCKAYIKEGKLDEAIKAVTKAHEVHPVCFNSAIMLGYIYRMKHDLKKSIVYYKKAMKLKPDNPKSYYNMGIVYKEMKKKKKAIWAFKKTVELDFFKELTKESQKNINELMRI